MGKVIYTRKFNKIGGMDMQNNNIEMLAMEILDINGFNGIVVDPVKLAASYGIEVKNAKFARSDVSGMLKRENGKTTIYVNSNDPIIRKRFTVAHELGHYFLKHLEENDKIIHRTNDFLSGDKKEIDANFFAAALLMNKYKIRELYNKLSYIGVPNELIVEKIASTFRVSKAAVRLRLKEIDLI